MSIEVNRSELNVQAMAERIVGAYNDATEVERLEGAEWYANAHGLARALGETHWGPGRSRRLDVAASKLAIISAGISWGQTVNAVTAAYRTGTCAGYTWGKNCLKVNAIMEQFSEPVTSKFLDPLDTTYIDPKDGQRKQALSGPKVKAFYRCILAAGKTGHVAVDRHMVHIMLGRTVNDETRSYLLRQLKTYDGYDLFVRAVQLATLTINELRKAAGEALLTAAQVQAIAWVWYRNTFEGRRRSTSVAKDPAPAGALVG